MLAGDLAIEAAAARVFDLLASVLDVVRERPDGVDCPAWCRTRGWESFLLGLTDAELEVCERSGPARALVRLAASPASLVDLAGEVDAVTRIDSPLASALPAAVSVPGLRPRKARQVAAMLAVGRPLAARARRLVDIGAGLGRFTALAAQTWNLPAVGIERDPRRVGAARAAAARLAPPLAEYRCAEVTDAAAGLDRGDLALGLHACGELGDAMVRAACGARCSLLLVACCHQKIAAPRRQPLSRLAAARGLALEREVLGLANLTTRADGFEHPLRVTLTARAHRHALAHILRGRGIDAPLDSLRHAARRRESFADWPSFARRAMARWDLPLPSPAELESSLERALVEVGRARRLSLPRHMLARVLELALAYDRAMLLVEAGLAPAVVEVFSEDASPRNLALVAEGAAA